MEIQVWLLERPERGGGGAAEAGFLEDERLESKG